MISSIHVSSLKGNSDWFLSQCTNCCFKINQFRVSNTKYHYTETALSVVEIEYELSIYEHVQY